MRFQRQELKFSLKTKNPRIAKTIALHATQDCFQLFDFIRWKLDLGTAEINDLARRHFAALLAQDLAERRSMGGRAALKSVIARPLRQQLDTTINDLVCQDFTAVSSRVERAMTASGIDQAGVDHQIYQEICNQFLRAERAALLTQLDRDQGMFHTNPDDPLFVLHSSPPTYTAIASIPQAPIAIGNAAEAHAAGLVADTLLPLSEYVKIVISKRGYDGKSAKLEGGGNGAKPGKTMEYKFDATIRAMIEIAGDKPIHAYRKIDIVNLKNALMKTPKKAMRNGGSILAAIKRNEAEARPAKTLALNTINNGYLCCVRQIFDYAVSNAAALSNVALGIKAETNINDREAAVAIREMFSIDDLNKIFAAPLYTGAKSAYYWHDTGRHFNRGYRFWLPLCMTFEGGRPQEFGQLELADVIDVDDYPCFRITNVVDDEDRIGVADEVLKKLKTAAAKRVVPVHPVLLALGFLDYVADLKRRKAIRLFPDWKADSNGVYSSVASKSFNGENRFLDRIGVKSERIALYSARHSYKDRLRAAGLQDSEQDYLMGHANLTVSGRYGSTAIYGDLINKFLLHVQYPGLDLSHIQDCDGPAFRPEDIDARIHARLQQLGVNLKMYLPNK